LAGPGCCTAGYESLDGNAGFVSGETFSYGYNWDWTENDDTKLLTGRYLAGRYTVSSSDSLQSLINKVNDGTQSRVGVAIESSSLATKIKSGGTLAVCVGDEAYVFGSATAAGGTYTVAASAGSKGFVAKGTFNAPGNLLYNRSNNIALTQAQRTALETLGVNLAALGLNSAVTINGTGSGESKEAASANLLANIGAALTALGIPNFNSITATGATNPGSLTDAAVDVSKFVVNAQGALDANNTAGHVRPNQSLDVHTGIWMDTNGNWTTEKSLGSDLGMSEIVFTIANPNTSSNTYRAYADYTATGIFIARDLNLKFTAGEKSTLSGAGVDFANLGAINPHVVASAGNNVSLTTAQGTVVAIVNGDLAAQAAQATQRINIGTTGAGGLVITPATFLTAVGYSTGDLPASGDSFTYTTDFWMDDAGNYTSSQSIATALKMGRVQIHYSKINDSTHQATMTVGGVSVVGFGAATAALNNTSTIDNVGTAFQTDLQSVFSQRQTAYTGGGKLVYANATATAPTITAANTTTETNANLQVWANGNSLTAGAFGSLLSHSNVGQIIAAINGTNGLGALGLTDRLTIAPPPTLGNGPLSTTDLVAGSYSNLAAIINATSGGTFSVTGILDSSKLRTMVATNTTALTDASGRSNFGAWALASAINNNKDSQFWAMVQSVNSNGQNADMVYIFTKAGGNFNDLLACEVAGNDKNSRSALENVAFENVQNAEMHDSGTSFTLGGEKWGTMKPTQTKSNLGNEVWNVTLNGRDVGSERDLWIANANEIKTPALKAGIINGMDRNSFVEIQNAADSPWIGGEIRTQSTAQAALDAITESINIKDKIRADLGALQNRLENTMTNLTVQSENLQASESRISDVDVATEMTEFTRNNVLSQAATSMLAQANSLSQLALSLIR
jgi:flagellin-like hook-associated protein FlgL